MEQVREVAMAYYKRSSAADKQLAHELFSVLDLDGDGRVTLAEYKNAIGSDNYTNKLFAAFDRNGDGILDLEEFFTLYYMIKVGMRNCDACSKFLMGSYFSCVLCEKDHPNCYDLCCACYGGGAFRHHHSTDNFLDDRSMRLLFLHFLKQDQNNITLSSSSVAPPPVQHNSSMRGMNAKKAFEAFSTTVSIGNTAYTLGSFAVTSGCTIM